MNQNHSKFAFSCIEFSSMHNKNVFSQNQRNIICPEPRAIRLACTKKKRMYMCEHHKLLALFSSCNISIISNSAACDGYF